MSSSLRARVAVNAPRTPHRAGTTGTTGTAGASGTDDRPSAGGAVVVAAIEGYRPKSLKELRQWDAVAGVCREVVAVSAPPSWRRAIELMRTVAHFASWAAGEGVAVQVESVVPARAC